MLGFVGFRGLGFRGLRFSCSDHAVQEYRGEERVQILADVLIVTPFWVLPPPCDWLHWGSGGGVLLLRAVYIVTKHYPAVTESGSTQTPVMYMLKGPSE